MTRRRAVFGWVFLFSFGAVTLNPSQTQACPPLTGRWVCRVPASALRPLTAPLRPLERMAVNFYLSSMSQTEFPLIISQPPGTEQLQLSTEGAPDRILFNQAGSSPNLFVPTPLGRLRVQSTGRCTEPTDAEPSGALLAGVDMSLGARPLPHIDLRAVRRGTNLELAATPAVSYASLAAQALPLASQLGLPLAGIGQPTLPPPPPLARPERSTSTGHGRERRHPRGHSTSRGTPPAAASAPVPAPVAAPMPAAAASPISITCQPAPGTPGIIPPPNPTLSQTDGDSGAPQDQNQDQTQDAAAGEAGASREGTDALDATAASVAD